MSISAISGSSAYSTYAQSTTTKKKTDDPMTQAISQLQTTDPSLASKLTDMQKKVESMKKAGASEKDVQSTVKSTMDGLNPTEKGELKSAMPTPPSGGPTGGGGHHHHAKAASDASTSTDPDSSTASIFSASSLLDSASSTQNDAIMNLLSSRSSSATDSSSYSAM